MGRKSKVLFTSHTANFSKFNRPFMRMLKEQGYEVHYASAGEEEVLDCDKHFTIPFERSPFKFNNLRAIWRLKKIIDTEHYDIIHTHTPMGSVVTRLAAQKARKNGTRVFYTAHGFHFFTGAPLANWLIYYPIEKIMARFTDMLITINKEDYERAKKKFSTSVRYVAGVGIDPNKFDVVMSKADKITLRKSLGLKHDDFVMLYTAELNNNKNQAMLLRAMERLQQDTPKAHLVLAGIDSLDGKLQTKAKELGIAHNVHFLGYRSDIPRILQIADLAVSASRREGLPVNLLEAMYVGLPIVATDCRGNRDLVVDGKNGYLVPRDDDVAIVGAIAKLLKISLQNDLGCVSRQMAEMYLIADIMDAMNALYGGGDIDAGS
jgi:glycosyltransferase EpsD